MVRRHRVGGARPGGNRRRAVLVAMSRLRWHGAAPVDVAGVVGRRRFGSVPVLVVRAVAIRPVSGRVPTIAAGVASVRVCCLVVCPRLGWDEVHPAQGTATGLGADDLRVHGTGVRNREHAVVRRGRGSIAALLGQTGPGLEPHAAQRARPGHVGGHLGVHRAGKRSLFHLHARRMDVLFGLRLRFPRHERHAADRAGARRASRNLRVHRTREVPLRPGAVGGRRACFGRSAAVVAPRRRRGGVAGNQIHPADGARPRGVTDDVRVHRAGVFAPGCGRGGFERRHRREERSIGDRPAQLDNAGEQRRLVGVHLDIRVGQGRDRSSARREDRPGPRHLGVGDGRGGSQPLGYRPDEDEHRCVAGRRRGA